MNNLCKRFGLSLLVALITACGGGGGSDSEDETAASAVIKLMPVSATAPSLSVLVDTDESDDTAASRLNDLSYGQGVSFNVAAETSPLLTVRYAVPQGAGTGQEYEDAFEAFNVEAATNTRYELFFDGEYPNGEYWTVETPRTFDESEEQARLTLVNAASTMTTMDVHVVPEGENLDASVFSTNLGAREADSAARLEPGAYQVYVTDAESATARYVSDSITFAAGDDQTMVALNNAWIRQDFANKPPIVMSRTLATGGSTLMFGANSGVELRVVHASSDAGAVAGPLDVVVDGTPAEPFETGLELGEVRDYQSLEAGIHQFQVMPTYGADARIDQQFNLFNGVAWTMFVLRPWDSLEPLFVSENVRSIAAHARFRFIHASSTAGTVDVYMVPAGAEVDAVDGDGAALYSPIRESYSLKQISPFLAVESGSYNLVVVATPTSETVEVEELYREAIELSNGEVAAFMLYDDADANLTHQWLPYALQTDAPQDSVE